MQTLQKQLRSKSRCKIYFPLCKRRILLKKRKLKKPFPTLRFVTFLIRINLLSLAKAKIKENCTPLSDGLN